MPELLLPPKTPPRVAITDVAIMAGVSKMSVSRALRGDRGISEATRERIRQMAAKLGYRPDPSVSKLMSRLRTSRLAAREPIAWITLEQDPGAWKRTPEGQAIYRGAVEWARELGYRLEELSLAMPGMTPKRLSQILHSRGIRGVVLAPLRDYRSIDGFAWERFATVCCGRALTSPALHQVSVDHFEVVRLAWDQLTRRGYRRIGLCVPAAENERQGHRWQAAIQIEQQALPSSDRVPPLLTTSDDPNEFHRWFAGHRPDAVLGFSEAFRWMKLARIRTPEDCGFAQLRLEAAGSVAGVDHRFGEIGSSVVALLAGELSQNQCGVPRVRRSIAIECAWCDGPTLR